MTVAECPHCLRPDCSQEHVECSPEGRRTPAEAELVRVLRRPWLAPPPPPPVVLTCECGERMVEPATRCGFCIAEAAELEAVAA
jgi:hypothetical protein